MEEKPIHIISLAKKKLVQRGIEEYLVFETLRKPEKVLDGYGGRRVAQKIYMKSGKKYLLRIVYEEKSNQLNVITGYLTSQISRYLGE